MAAKGGNVVDVNGEEYVVRCGWDHPGRDIAARSAASFGDCQPLCDATPGCQAYSYLGGDGPGTRYLKDSLSGGALSYADFASKVGALPVVATSTTVASAPTTSTTVNPTSTSASSVVMVTSTEAAPTMEMTTVFLSSTTSSVVEVTTTQTSQGPVATDGHVDIPANNPPVEHEDVPAESSTVMTSTSTIRSASTSTSTRRVRASSAFASATMTTTTVRYVTRTTTRPAAATATGPVVDPVDTNHGCGALNHKGGMFYLRTHVTHGNVLRFENLYLQQTPYGPTSVVPTMSANRTSATEAYFDASTASIATWHSECRWTGLGMVLDADNNPYGDVLINMDVGTSKMDTSYNALVWDNDRFGSWLVCDNSGRNVLKYWDPITTQGIDTAVCAKVQLLTEYL
ncbi:hypothetical protein B0A49_11916 [Cryomyces minteri]|uniref:DUF7907 domain-containing protein n=1 Tax=Cryomyces minteri TaxID=331657 RepID=A0A4U0WEG8_9PEZI|nr:hypothetical protein B0A49_11916 [Cryomyces minteri]